MQHRTHHRRIFVLFGDQLFAFKHLKCVRRSLFYMAEDEAMCARLPYHKHKLTFTLASMRHYGQALRRSGLDLCYLKLADRTPGESYWQTLAAVAQDAGVGEIAHFESEDPTAERRVALLARSLGLQHTVMPSPKFICSRRDFDDWAESAPSFEMQDFYAKIRQQHGFLLDAEGRPLGGRLGLDTDNRKPLPRQLPLPDLPVARKRDRVRDKTMAEVNERFAHHPGRTEDFWLPVTARHASAWLDDFLEHRLTCFGDYQHALTRRSDTVFHSVISPFLNAGLLTPADVVERATRFAEGQDIALNNIEGFIRQVVGWREFVRGAHRRYGQAQSTTNWFSARGRLTRHWFEATTGIEPLDDTIRKVERLGWAHHTERLMIVGNLMCLCEIEPREAHDWFLTMFVDASRWIVGPVVYGMALHSDGGLLSSRPNICGSSYILKMSDYERGPWCDIVDGLYWRFVARHRDVLSADPQMNMVPRSLDCMDATRRSRLFEQASNFLAEKTVLSGIAA